LCAGEGNGHLLSDLIHVLYMSCYLREAGFGTADGALFRDAAAALERSAARATTSDVWKVNPDDAAVLERLLALRAAGSCTFHAALRFRIGHAAVCLGRRTRGDTDMLLGLKGALNLTARVSAADSFSKMLSLSTPRSDIPQCPSPVAASGDSRLTSEGAPRSKDPFLPLYAHR
jgi:hypothetical protein